MNKRFIAPSIAILVAIIAVWIFDSGRMEYKKIQGFTQGTTYHITYEYEAGVDLKPEIDELLHNFDSSLSTYNPASIISKVNRNDELEVDELFTEVFQVAEKVYQKTDGAFDITIAPIVNAWGFGSGAELTTDSATIDSLLQFVGMDKLSLEGKRVVKAHPSVQLNVNAIAQGYSVDIVAEWLEQKGVNNYLVEIGGELRCKGISAKGKSWTIGIDQPEEGNMVAGQNLQAIVSLDSKALATSGNYRKFYEKDGVKYTHSIDPKTGYPVQSRLLSATVLADECILADAYATAFMVMGLEKSMEYLRNDYTIEAYLIYSDAAGNYAVHTSRGMVDYLAE